MRLAEPALRVARLPDGRLEVDTAVDTYHAEDVYNCTYSQLNTLLRRSGLPAMRLKHELAEVALIRPSPALEGIGITVMCGPFFSSLPFPARGLHSLTHVEYTPRCSWTEGTGSADEGSAPPAVPRITAARSRMLAHASRFVPVMAESEYVDSLWEVKTILPQNENNDGRPILFARDHGLPGLHCVLGAKVDNIYDLLDEVDKARAADRQEQLVT